MQIIEPRLTDYQRQMIDSPARFTITEATTKAGKTFSHIWWLFSEAHGKTKSVKPGDRFVWLAPIYSQAKIAFNRIVRKISGNPYYQINQSSLEILTPLKTVLSFRSADNPDSLYGDDSVAVVIDEGSRMKEESWIAIRSTLVATNGKAKMIGNVRGTDNWYYRLARKVEAGQLTDWAYFKFTADDAVREGILKQQEIDEAKATLPNGMFLELFYAIPFVNTANKFAFAFNPEKHIAKTQYRPNLPLYVSFDFNRSPITCTCFQHDDKGIEAIESIKLENSNIYNLCDVLLNKHPKALFIINGDATGRAGSALVRDNINYYRVIKSKLNLSDSQIKVPSVNPSIAENQVLVNAVLEHINVKIDPDKCSPLIHDLQFVEMLPDGSIKKGDRSDPNQQADILDGFRYYLNANFKWLLRQYLG